MAYQIKLHSHIVGLWLAFHHVSEVHVDVSLYCISLYVGLFLYV